MADSLQEQSLLVADALKNAIETINGIPTRQDFHMVKTRVVTGLQRQVNELVTQSGGNSEARTHDYSAPLTSVLGIAIPSKVVPADAGLDPNKGNTMIPPAGKVLTPEDIAADEIRAVVDQLYPEFLNIDTASIVDKHSDIEIRAVAKRAGIPVTEKSPKHANAKFVEQIKAAIIKKNEIEAAGNVGDDDDDEEGNDENE